MLMSESFRIRGLRWRLFRREGSEALLATSTRRAPRRRVRRGDLVPGLGSEPGEGDVSRRRSFTSQLYRLARTSNNLRAASRGPAAYAKRRARAKAYGRSMGATGKLLRIFGLGR